jgi:hypothetical protein
MRSMKRFLTALSICLLLGASVDIAVVAGAFAQQKSSWNGTWIGNWATGDGTQIVFAGNELIAMYWHGDYLSDTQSSVSPDGGTVTITWQSGHALLTRDGEARGHIVVHEEGQPDATFDVKRDNQ